VRFADLKTSSIFSRVIGSRHFMPRVMPALWHGHQIPLRHDAPLVIPTGMAQRAAAQPRLGKAITSAPRSRASGALRFRASWSLSPLSAHRSWRRSASCWAMTWIACLTTEMRAVSASLAIKHPLFSMKASDKLAAEVVQ